MTDATNDANAASAGFGGDRARAKPNDAAPAQKWPPITEADANVIGALTDPAYRNLRITQAYHDLKIALARQLGPRNVTWCAYATWASKTAGSFIRAEEVPGLVREYLAKADHLGAALQSLNEKLGAVHADAKIAGPSFLIGTIEAVMHDVTADVARGNLLVFQELAPLYAKWLRSFGGERGSYDLAEIDAFVSSTFKPGPVESGGQDLLIQAFRTYYEALYESDEAKKAQQMFLANALVGYHEQVRLQQPILSSLNAPLVDVFLNNAKAIARGKLPHVLHGAVELLVENVLRPVAKRVEEEWHEVSTRWMMTLTLPSVVLSLGQDVPGLSETEMFPEHLREATYEPLVSILAKLDRTPNTVLGSAARDWGLVEDRMNYIVDFFRSRQQDPSLYEQPFTDEQVAMIHDGTMPTGRL
jgi:hypothetical protein